LNTCAGSALVTRYPTSGGHFRGYFRG